MEQYTEILKKYEEVVADKEKYRAALMYLKIEFMNDVRRGYSANIEHKTALLIAGLVTEEEIKEIEEGAKA